MNNKKGAAYRQGFLVLVTLAVLTAVEFWVSTIEIAVVWLILIALLKTALIVQFFMHIYRLWREEEH